MKIFFIFIFLASATIADAATYWVSPGGTASGCVNSSGDPGNGGSRNTVNSGIACLTGGDTLYITKGTYYEGISSHRSHINFSCTISVCIPDGKAGAPTRIMAAPGHERQVILNSFGNTTIWISGFHQYIEIKGLVLTPDRENAGAFSSSRAIGIGCPYVSDIGDNVCSMQGATVTCSGFWCVTSSPAYPMNMTVENNEIRNCSKSCVGMGISSPLSTELMFFPYTFNGMLGSVFRNNDVHDCGSDGMDHCLYVGGRMIFENNRIWNSAGQGIQEQDGGKCYCSDGAIFRGNMIWDTAGYPITSQEYNKQNYNNITFKSGTNTGCDPWLAWDGQCHRLGVSGEGIGIISFDGPGSRIENNTVWNMQYAIGLQRGGDTVFNNNVCAGCSAGVLIIFTDPGDTTYNQNIAVAASALVDPGNPVIANKNFQIASGSGPLTNTGVSAPSVRFTTDANGTARPQPSGGQWDIGACEWFSGAGKCPNFAAITPPPVVASITINSPVSGGRYITTTQNQMLAGTASCGTATFSSITWVNDKGGSGGATGFPNWTSTGTGATLTPNTINTITVTVNCTNPVATASATLRIAYNPPESLLDMSFDENSGTTPQDSSGKGNHGSFGAGVAYISTAGNVKYGTSALDFSGGSVTVNSTSIKNQVIGGFSMVAWIKPDTISTTAMQAAVVNNYSEYLYLSNLSTGGCQAGTPLAGFAQEGTGENLFVCPSTPLQLNTYSCLAVTYNGSNLVIYVNNVPTSRAMNYEFPVSPATGNFQIGNSQFSEPPDAKIDEVRFRQFGMTAAEVKTACETPIGGGPPASPSGLKIGSVSERIGNQPVGIGF